MRNPVPAIHSSLCTLLVIGVMLLSPGGFARAAESGAELVMFERTGCIWCKRWDVEVGRVYPLTEEGKSVPLRRVNIDRGVPEEFRLMPPVFYSPTFVLISDGKEQGRITGYAGDDAFWGQFGAILRQRDARPAP